MAKPPVLGNDPFQRGAASRPDAPAAAPEPAPAAAKPVPPAAAKPSAAKGKPAPVQAKPGKGKSKAARAAQAASQSAKPAAKAKPAPAIEAPAAPAAKPAAKAKPAPAIETPAAPAAKPAPAIETPAAPATKPAAKAKHAPAVEAPAAPAAKPAAKAKPAPAIETPAAPAAKPAAKAKAAPAIEAPAAPAAKPAPAVQAPATSAARPAAKAKPAPVAPTAKPQPQARAGAAKPGAKAERAAAKAKAPANQPKAAEEVAAKPEPAPGVPPVREAKPEARPPVEAVKPAAEAPANEAARPLERTAVIEGEVVAVHPPRSLFVPEPPPPSAEAPSARPSLLAQLRHGTLSTLQGLAQAAMESFAARRGQTAATSSWLDRAGAVGAGVASATAPVFETARALLPPAVGAARSVASAVTSGKVIAEAAGAAAEAASAVRQAARRSEPSMLEFDLFGEDPGLTSRLEPIFDFLHDRYFRVAVHGASQVPAGPCLVVCNHAGVLPIDGPMMRTVLRRECGRAEARWLVEDSVFHAPFVGDLLNRLGAVRACPENAERLLAKQTAVVVFPEGVLGSGKTVRERYRLQRFGRGGFVKLAMRAGVPIVPAAIVGAEDTQPLLARLPIRGLGSLPITPTFPWFGPLGLVPFPSKWTVSFLPPVDVRAHGAAGAEDLALVGRITEEVRGALQSEIDRLLAEREPQR